MQLYVHIPFCVRKCAYCDFLSAPSDQGTMTKYVQALLGEIRAVREPLGERISSVYIGGGTHSLLEGDLLALLLRELNRKFYISPDAEITMEANPGTLSMEKLQVMRDWGVNRLSIGLQSPKESDLRTLGRIHTYADFLESFQMAREVGFRNIGVDLMYALPDQTRASWRAGLSKVAALGAEHLSCYCLTIEEGTPFATRQLNLPGEEEQSQMMEDTREVLAAFGYLQYEFSNYAKPGFASRHNIGYWTRAQYLGLGLGAASLVGEKRFSNTSSLEEYLALSKWPSKIRRDQNSLSREDAMSETLFLGLRMTHGIPVQGFQRCFGVPLESVFGSVIEKHKALGLLKVEDGRVFLTRRGILVSNQVLCDFLL